MPRLLPLTLLLPLALCACSPQALGAFFLRSAAASLGLPPPPEAQGSAVNAWGANSLDPPPSEGEPVGDFFLALNQARRLAGLQAAAWKQELALGAAKHLAYLATNAQNEAAQGMKALTEEAHLPGYSAQGAKAAEMGQLAAFPPAQALPKWLGSPYHRLALLDPRLRAVALAWSSSGEHASSLAVFERLAEHEGGPYPVAYPSAQQSEVPLHFEALGDPSPLAPGITGPVGYPISLCFPPEQNFVLDSATLLDAQGQAQPCFVSHPGAPASAFPQQGMVCLVPKIPLLPGSSYEVRIFITPQGEAMKPYRWRFHTTKSVSSAAKQVLFKI